jgi:hypothetical protein
MNAEELEHSINAIREQAERRAKCRHRLIVVERIALDVIVPGCVKCGIRLTPISEKDFRKLINGKRS